MTECVFVNRILNLRHIKYVGFDMDHTLIRYKTKNFESLVYQYVIDDLIKSKGYPKNINKLAFDFDSVIRGLVVDSKNGNILKLSRHGGIRQSYHGTQLINFKEQRKFYRGTYVDLNNPDYMAIDTAFSIAFCAVYSQLVDLADADPKHFPSYDVMAQEVLQSVDVVHAAGFLKQQISENLSDFVIKDPAVVEGLKHYAQSGKTLFIVTNSDYNYTRLLLDYAIKPFLEKGETWEDLFEYIITLADKPRFFHDNLRFLRIDPVTGLMRNHQGPLVPGVYQGGDASKFTDSLKLTGDQVLYIGDHIYGDILRLRKDCNWRTALVVEELGAEIASQEQALPVVREIEAQMKVKKQFEQEYIAIQAKRTAERTKQYDDALNGLQTKIAEIDTIVVALIKKQHSYFNQKWERVFRAGAEESYFAFQVERFACIYMEKLTDLLGQSPYTYFRPHRRLMAHDIEVDEGE